MLRVGVSLGLMFCEVLSRLSGLLFYSNDHCFWLIDVILEVALLIFVTCQRLMLLIQIDSV